MSTDIQKNSIGDAGAVARAWVQVSWVCAKCGARGSGMADPEHTDLSTEACLNRAAVSHDRKRKCSTPDISVHIGELDADALLGTPAEAIRAMAKAKAAPVMQTALPEPEPLPATQRGSYNSGPWARPDYF